MLFQVKAYFKFLLKSQNQHGLHSPFVYDLVTKCFYNKAQYPEYSLIKDYRNALLSNRSQIKVTDFGAGSRVFKSDVRPVYAIAKHAGITLHRAKLLSRITQYLNIEQALELGTSLGIGSAALASNRKTELTTIEGCKQTGGVAKIQFREFDLKNISLKIGDFKDEIEKLVRRNKKFDLIYFDGNHQKDATLKYFEQLLPTAHNDSVFIFDDIHWSKGMEEAWEELKLHPEVTVSIDTFKWGLVFFRKEQAKQDFVIRL